MVKLADSSHEMALPEALPQVDAQDVSLDERVMPGDSQLEALQNSTLSFESNVHLESMPSSLSSLTSSIPAAMQQDLKQHWDLTNRAQQSLESGLAGNVSALDSGLMNLGRAVRAEMEFLTELAEQTNSSPGSSLTSAERQALAERWEQISELFDQAKQMHFDIKPEVEAHKERMSEDILEDSNARLRPAVPQEALSARALNPDEQRIESGMRELGWERGPDGEFHPTEASLRGTHDYEIGKGIEAIEKVKSLDAAGLVSYLQEKNSALALEAARTKSQIEQYLEQTGQGEQYRVEGPLADIDESLPEMIQDPKTGDWSLAPGQDTLLSLRWKVVALEKRSDTAGHLATIGEYSFDKATARARGESVANWNNEEEQSVEATRFQQIIVSSYSKVRELQEMPAEERNSVQQALVEAHERRQFLQSKMIYPGDEGQQVMDTWSDEKTIFRTLSESELLEAKKEYFELGHEVVALMEKLAPESVARADYLVEKYAERTVNDVEERQVGYIQRNVAGYLLEEVGKWSLNRNPSDDPIVERINEKQSIDRLASGHIHQFFTTSQGDIDRQNLAGDVERFKNAMSRLEGIRERVAQNAAGLVALMQPDSSGIMHIPSETHNRLNADILHGRRETLEEWSSRKRAEHLSQGDTLTATEQAATDRWQGMRDISALGDERQTRAARLAGYGISHVLSAYWSAHADQINFPSQAQELYHAFSNRTTVESYDVMRQDGTVRAEGHTVSGAVPLGHPIRTGAYAGLFGETYGGEESFVIPVGHAGMEVGYITITQGAQSGALEYRLYDIKGAPFRDPAAYESFVSDTSRDRSGYRTGSVGQVLSERGESGLLASGADAVAREAQRLWYTSAASKLSPADHAYLTL